MAKEALEAAIYLVVFGSIFAGTLLAACLSKLGVGGAP